MLQHKRKRIPLLNEYLNNPPDFEELSNQFEEFKQYVYKTKSGSYSINWNNAKAVLTLNKCLLKKDFNIDYYDIPSNFLIPTIPSRINYLLFLKKLLMIFNLENKEQITVIDIGTGANIIYPLLGYSKYHWHFIASDTNIEAIDNAKMIIKNNHLENDIDIKYQNDSMKIFEGIIDVNEYNESDIIFSMCNPPFYDSETEVKFENVNKDNEFNFNEVYYKGGEFQFIMNIIQESEIFKNKIFIFTSLMGKKTTFKKIKKILTQDTDKFPFVKYEKLVQGNNVRWVIAWSYFRSYSDFKNQNNK